MGKTRAGIEIPNLIMKYHSDKVRRVAYAGVEVPEGLGAPPVDFTRVKFGENMLCRLLLGMTNDDILAPGITLRFLADQLITLEKRPTMTGTGAIDVLVLHLDEFQRNPDGTANMLRAIHDYNGRLQHTDIRIIPVCTGLSTAATSMLLPFHISTFFTHHLVGLSSREDSLSLSLSVCKLANSDAPLSRDGAVIPPLVKFLSEDMDNWAYAQAVFGALLSQLTEQILSDPVVLRAKLEEVEANVYSEIGQTYPSEQLLGNLGIESGSSAHRKLLELALSEIPVRLPFNCLEPGFETH